VRRPTRLGTATRGFDTTTVDLGTEPPLIVGDETSEAPVRRAVSWRWLTGTVLTGFTSIFLMGGALMTALDNPNQFATSPESSDTTLAGAESDIDFGEKGDRIRPIEAPVASRQILQVSTVTRQGERDFIKLRPFAKITASLTTRKDFAIEFPAYDALRIFADNSPPDAPEASPAGAGAEAAADDQIYGANVDGEVSVKVSDFPLDDPDVDSSVGLDTPEVEMIVRASANFAPDGERVAALPYVDPTRFIDESGDEDPFSALGVRIIPENVSNIAKSEDDLLGEGAIDEKVIAVTKGVSFRALLQKNEVSGDDADQIVAALSGMVDLNRLHVGQKIRVAFAADLDAAAARPIRISVYDDGAHQATVARADDNSFVRADEPNSEGTAVAEAEVVEEPSGGLPRVYDALYETALEQQVPPPLVDQLVRIFAFDVDFQSRITPGDSLEVFHSLPDTSDEDAAEPEVLFAALTLGGVAKRFYRFRTSDDGYVDYYDEEGKSAKKFLMRKPITTGILRSGFGSRVHPILGYRRMHTGVDFSAPRGTPILAAGNGVVEKAGRTSGYGNFTLIRHTNGYATAYGHQSAYAKGLVPGARVRQGQIIGYVGSTGLSTGPHLHFEIRVNKSPVDPLRIRLPRGRVLEGDLLLAFERERERIDALLGYPAAPTKVAAATN
jgi:murein DD-endopeptidase MepM/ murein hydrolase activator NlpD